MWFFTNAISIIFTLPFLSQLTLPAVNAIDDFVRTSKGYVVGRKARDGDYTAFFGIPYAQVNENNPFENSLEQPDFTTPFNASDPFVRCPQAYFNPGGILQCLRLNIYVPNSYVDVLSSGLPVYVWFHGGGLAFGSAGEYNASHLVQSGIIVVTANYRLGPYGFLCTSEIKNQGLEDMKTALRWIRKEIREFGGNAYKVTIGGESWGASAVDYLLYEEADFNQAILESGSRFSFGVSTREDNNAPIKLAKNIGFHTNKYKDAINFLNSADPVQVMEAAKNLNLTFGVCENLGEPHLNDSTGKIRNTPILIGYNSKEAFADFATQTDMYYEKIYEEFVSNLFKIFDLSQAKLRTLADVILSFYLGNKTISRNAMLELIDLSSDFRVNYGAERSVANYLRFGNSRVYKYIFGYTGGSPYKNIPGVGAYHTEELPYLFGWGTPLKTEEQFRLRRNMITLWSNFIIYGDPTPKNSPHKWQPSNLYSRPYLYIDVESKTEMKHNAYYQRIALWDSVWASYGKYRK